MSRWTRAWVALLGIGWAAMGQIPTPSILDALDKALTERIPGTKVVFYTLAKPVLNAVPVTDALERAYGDRLYQSIAKKRKSSLDRPGQDLNYLRAVGGKLARHVKRTSIPYSFHLVEAESVNAFAHAGGHVYLYRGLFRRLQNEAQLAAVLGHEIAHVELTHTQDAIRPLVAAHDLKDLVPGISLDTLRLMTGISQAVAGSIYSEPQEYEADAAGVRLAFAAGYDPREAVRMWVEGPVREARARQSDGIVSKATHLMFQSHPQAQARKQALNRIAEQLIQSRPGDTLLLGKETFEKRKFLNQGRRD